MSSYSLAGGSSRHFWLCVSAGNCSLIGSDGSFSWPQVVSSHMRADQYSAEYLRGTLCTSPGFSVCAALSSPALCSETSTHLGLPRLGLSLGLTSFVFLSLGDHCPSLPTQCLQSCLVILVVSGRKVHLIPVTLSWSGAYIN